ncbi:uncharacterized protein (DUF1015 family) [Lewinella aquimaris]|uniref:Uncharacterized protein (DUF1015 family) n=1 Tax=Neolewinella aquimaris TaxID=1835722 RepID=A0A840EED6_9BACT|nr:DUF1015 family protein [Neolewinella aquimaris]MBB4079306.1 uncharacterized protein (DUF1015 family) [Neolewinella aquimaris]
MPQLLPFPQYHRPPGEAVTELPVTRNGIRSLTPLPFEQQNGPSFPFLRISDTHNGHTVRGVAGLLPATYFGNGTVRPHENTLLGRLERQRRLIRTDDGALGKPVLLTVPSLKEWWSTHTEEPSGQVLHYHNKRYRYALSGGYRGPSVDLQEMGSLVIADGHHRAYTHAALAVEGLSSCNHIPVVIIGADELRIGTFMRVIDGIQSPEELLRRLAPHFSITQLADPVPVDCGGDWLLSYREAHYLLRRKEQTVGQTDSGWLNATILAPVFGITDVRADIRLAYLECPRLVDGVFQMPPELQSKIKLIGRPILRERFFSEVAAGRTLPPKSTRFEPRVPSGLLVWIP